MIEKLGYHNWPILGHKFGLAPCFGQRSVNIFLKKNHRKDRILT